MIIEVDNDNLNNKDLPDKITREELTQEKLDELFSVIDDVDFISWEFERKLRKRNIL